MTRVWMQCLSCAWAGQRAVASESPCPRCSGGVKVRKALTEGQRAVASRRAGKLRRLVMGDVGPHMRGLPR